MFTLYNPTIFEQRKKYTDNDHQLIINYYNISRYSKQWILIKFHKVERVNYDAMKGNLNCIFSSYLLYDHRVNKLTNWKYFTLNFNIFIT